MKMEPNPSNPCFGCGGANDRGMKLAFELDPDRRRIVGHFQLGREYQGGAGFIHGGIIATVLDEAMGKLCRLSDLRAVTAELSVEYLKPVPVGALIRVEAFEQEREGRHLLHRGEIRNGNGDLLARGRGRFVVIDPTKFKA